MTLLLERPAIAAMSCTFCQTWLVDIETGQVKERRGKPQKRGNAATPCWQCPKESPEKAWLHELHAANWQTVERFLEVRATSGACLSKVERSDDYLMHLFAVVDMVLRQHDRQLDSLFLERAIHGRGTSVAAQA